MTGADIAPKIASLVRLVGSPIDGEALGAARAIGRTLAGAGRDLHWLAGRVEAGLEPTIVYRDALGRKTKPPTDLPPLYEELPRSQRLDWLEIGIGAPSLSEWQREFCASLRAQQYSQPHKIVNPKQRAAANEVFVKLFFAGECV